MNGQLYHLAVERVRKGDNRLTIDCLCLNGSAHALTARNEAAVTCPKCLAIRKLEREGFSREEARHKIIWGEVAPDTKKEHAP